MTRALTVLADPHLTAAVSAVAGAATDAANEELGLVEHIVRDVEIKLTTCALLLTLPHARALPLSDDVGKYKLASVGMTNSTSLAAQKAQGCERRGKARFADVFGR